MSGSRIPLRIQEGGCAIKKKMQSYRNGADGVVGIDEVFLNATSPSAPLNETARLLLKSR